MLKNGKCRIANAFYSGEKNCLGTIHSKEFSRGVRIRFLPFGQIHYISSRWSQQCFSFRSLRVYTVDVARAETIRESARDIWRVSMEGNLGGGEMEQAMSHTSSSLVSVIEVERFGTNETM